MARRKSGSSQRNSGRWTEAKFRSFIVSAIRSATGRWGPKQNVLKRARTRRGFFRCEGCTEELPTYVAAPKGRRRNMIADHIHPVVDPHKGFTTWDEYIERMFVEEEGFQVLCLKCHAEKTRAEKAISKERKKNELLPVQ